MGKVILDTNVILDFPNIFVNNKDKIFVISSIVAEELDNQVHSKYNNKELSYKARVARNAIKNADNVEYMTRMGSYSMPIGWNTDKNDNLLLQVSKDLQSGDKECVLYTNDLLMQMKAESIGLVWSEYVGECSNEEYKGYRTVEMNDDELADFYANKDNKWDLNVNEYLLIRHNNEVVDKYKWTEKGFKTLDYKSVNSRAMGKIKPVNIEQQLLFDTLQDKNLSICVCRGIRGSGKDFVMISHALQMIENGKYDKIIWIRNNIEVKNSKPIGFLKGSQDEKLLPYAMNLSDHLGGKMALELFIQQGKVELQHLGFLRGRDLKNSILYVTEAENMTKEHIQLVMGRVGEGSLLYINGDYKQVDDVIFEHNNGLNIMIDKLKGNENFGMVQLVKTERSKTAAMADLLD